MYFKKESGIFIMCLSTLYRWQWHIEIRVMEQIVTDEKIILSLFILREDY